MPRVVTCQSFEQRSGQSLDSLLAEMQTFIQKKGIERYDIINVETVAFSHWHIRLWYFADCI